MSMVCMYGYIIDWLIEYMNDEWIESIESITESSFDWFDGLILDSFNLIFHFQTRASRMDGDVAPQNNERILYFLIRKVEVLYVLLCMIEWIPKFIDTVY